MTRRQILWSTLLALGGVSGVALMVAGYKLFSHGVRSSLGSQTLEPGSSFRAGRPSDFGVGVDARFLPERRVYVVRNPERLFVIYASCTHLGCTPDWDAGRNKFTCPCHGSSFCFGSAFDGDGINCDGPAPRPLDRAHVELDAESQIVVDVSRRYQQPAGGRSGFDEPGASLPLGRG